MIRSIVVHADQNPGSGVRLDNALAIARRHGAHVTAHLNLPLQRFFGTDPFGGAYVVTDALALAQADLADQKAAVELELAGEDVPWDVVATDVDLVSGLASVGALSDLVIVGRHAASGSGPVGYPMLAGDLAMAVRVPVLALVPDHIFDLDGAALVGWNGSAEAAAALRLARPLLKGGRSRWRALAKLTASFRTPPRWPIFRVMASPPNCARNRAALKRWRRR